MIQGTSTYTCKMESWVCRCTDMLRYGRIPFIISHMPSCYHQLSGRRKVKVKVKKKLFLGNLLFFPKPPGFMKNPISDIKENVHLGTFSPVWKNFTKILYSKLDVELWKVFTFQFQCLHILIRHSYKRQYFNCIFSSWTY